MDSLPERALAVVDDAGVDDVIASLLQMRGQFPHRIVMRAAVIATKELASVLDLVDQSPREGDSVRLKHRHQLSNVQSSVV